MAHYKFTEDDVELAALEWLGEVGYGYLGGPEIAPGESAAERGSYRDVILEGRLRIALAKLNPDLPRDALAEALRTKPAATQQLWMAAYGLGAQFGVILPYSRLHEYEADRLGLIFMAMAGYDPNAAIGFWQRMAAHKGGAAPPEFLSTHPSDQKRIKSIRSLIPEAMQYYQP